VDIWTETLEASEYDALAMMIAKGVTTEVDTPTETGPDVEDGRGSVAGSVASVTGERKKSPERRYVLKADEGIVYDPNITREPVYMEDIEEQADGYESGDQDEQDGGTAGGGENASRGRDKKEGGGGGGGGGTEAGGGELRSGAGAGAGRKAPRKPGQTRFGGARKTGPPGSPGRDCADDGGAGAAVSSLAQQAGRSSKVALLSAERVNATIAKIYFSKMQVDRKLLTRDGSLSWVDKCRRKKDQRMDRFVLQFHVRQFGTKKLARRNLHQLCKSITKLAPTNPRIAA
ncbi:unnamed protein product, partial [Ectocarpus sp. 6 AP-2014]